jgi:hypothetical protein
MSTIDIVNFTLHIGLKTEAYQNYYEQLLALDASLTLLVGGGGVRIAIYTNIIGGRSFTILSPSVCCLLLYILLQGSQRHMSENQENRQENFRQKSGIVKLLLILPFMVKSVWM